MLLKGEARFLCATESVCPQCLQKIPAARVARGEQVYLEKTCPEHGSFEVPVWRGKPSYESWVKSGKPGRAAAAIIADDPGCPFVCGLCPEHRQSTCCVLLEVTSRCNIRCSVCFADAGGSSADPDLETVRGWYRRLLEAGGPYNIQLSGGEPTLRDDLPEIVALGRAMGFNYIQLNTNGLRLSREPEFLKALQQAGLSAVFLQFDGTEPDIHVRLRGGDFLNEKLEAVRLCGEMGIGVILVPTVVPGVNDHNLGGIIELALARIPLVRGVHIQPVSYFGRYDGPPSEQMRITIPEVISRIEEQTGGRIQAGDFLPSGCLDSLCSFHANFIFMPDGNLRATTRHDDNSNTGCCCGAAGQPADGAVKTRNFVAARWSAPAVGQKPQESCCCKQNKEMDSLDLFLERARTHTFCISGMAFQDAWNLELDRLRYCYVHTLAPDGRIIPFCAYNLTSSRGEPLYRGSLSACSEKLL